MALVALLAVVISWKPISLHPVYVGSHSHTAAESHDHTHTHSKESFHGHQHVGLVGTVTHSHPHLHDHRHEVDVEMTGTEGLTEIGHRHISNATVIFWARAEVSNSQVHLTCWSHHGREVVEVTPDECSAVVLEGGRQVGTVFIKRVDGNNVGNLPEGFFYLPTQVLKLTDLKVGGYEFDTVIPLEMRPE